VYVIKLPSGVFINLEYIVSVDPNLKAGNGVAVTWNDGEVGLFKGKDGQRILEEYEALTGGS